MELRRLACLLLVASSAAACAEEGTAGLTLMGLTPSYLVVLNVVGPEQM